jgi:ABC-2 type transport system permease protein
MYKIYHAILKELRLLRRDLLGFAIIFLMPVVLIITITFIQNSVENNSANMQLPVLLVNLDKGALSKKVIDNLENNNGLKIITENEGKALTEEKGRDLIKKGIQKILIVIPNEFSSFIENQTDGHVNKLMSKVMPDMESKPESPVLNNKADTKEVQIHFDPAISSGVKTSIKGAIASMISDLETKAIYETFEKEFDADFSFLTEQPLISFKEYSVTVNNDSIEPTAVQHNLPAWTLFAIFFIIIPLSINIVKEKNQGTYIRLKTLPVSSFYLMLSKIIVYLMVCMVQFYLMLMVSVYLFPNIGLPALDVEGKLIGLSIVALFSGLAAIGFGVLIGTFAKTHEQAAPFGATSVVILAAIGGLWFPVFAMPEKMQMIAKISPMNWGLEAFYNVLLRNSDLISLAPYLLLLLTFFIINIIIAVAYEKKINQL